MARKFLISYSGRVGSTALIDTLKMIEGFLVPVFEDLDFWWIENNGQLSEHNVENIHEIVDFVYNNIPDSFAGKDLSIGFKWRIWGNIEKVGATLKANNVLILNMVRCDIIEFISSLYLTDIVHKEFNAPQFRLRDAATEEERERLLSRYRFQRQSVDLKIYFDLYAKRLAAERNRLELVTKLRDSGLPVYTILYEDFAYKRFDFLNALLRLLGHSPLESLPITKLTKVSSAYPSEMFVNRDELLASQELMPMLREWNELVYGSGFPVLACIP